MRTTAAAGRDPGELAERQQHGLVAAEADDLGGEGPARAAIDVDDLAEDQPRHLGAHDQADDLGDPAGLVHHLGGGVHRRGRDRRVGAGGAEDGLGLAPGVGPDRPGLGLGLGQPPRRLGLGLGHQPRRLGLGVEDRTVDDPAAGHGSR